MTMAQLVALIEVENTPLPDAAPAAGSIDHLPRGDLGDLLAMKALTHG